MTSNHHSQKLIIIFIVLLVIFVPFFTNADKYSTINSQNPPGIAWKKLDTKHFQLIFPDELTAQAINTANMLELYYPLGAFDFDKNINRITLVIHNQSTISNGWMSPIPKRMEFLHTPPQEIDQNWFSLLTIHEYRHTAQYANTYYGLTQLAYWLFGDIGGSLVFLTTPSWLWEGDAVFAETIFTSSGRGRQASFSMPLRMMLAEKGIVDYDAVTLFSYRDVYPNPYELGYVLTSYLRDNYDNKMISRLYKNSAWLPFTPLAFSLIMRHQTGFTDEKIYKKAMADFKLRWEKDTELLKYSTAQQINVNPKVYTIYSYPYSIEGNKVVAFKNSLSTESAWVTIDSTGHEELLVKTGYFSSGKPSFVNNIIAWSQYQPDLRWGMQDYSNIYLYNINNHTQKQLTKKQRYFSPAINSDGTKIATVEFTTDNKHFILILDASNGKVIKQLSNPENDYLITPTWVNSNTIAYIKLTKNGKTIVMYNLDSDTATELFEPINENIYHLTLAGDYLLYYSPYSGIDNIYAIKMDTAEKYQVTSAKYGAYDPSVSQDLTKLVYTDFGKTGFNVVEAPFIPENWIKIKDIKPIVDDRLDRLVEQNFGHDVMKNVPDSAYQVKDYHPNAHLTHFHSWFPAADVGFDDVSFSLVSQDYLNLLNLEVGAQYLKDSKSLGYFLNASYQGFYPIIDFDAKSEIREISEQDSTDTETSDSKYDNSIGLTLRLPFDFSHKNHFTYLLTGITTNNTKLSDDPFDFALTNDIQSQSLYSNEYFLSFSNYTLTARRDILPPWAQQLYFSYEHSLASGFLDGWLFTSSASLAFPGLFEDQTSYLKLGYEQTDISKYQFGSNLVLPRGYDEFGAYKDLATISANYALPIAYPDKKFGALVFVNRLWMNLFVDYGYKNMVDSDNQMISLGSEFIIDMIPFRLPVGVNAAFRYVYLPEEKESKYEFDLYELNF
jgi:hypothetical protein